MATLATTIIRNARVNDDARAVLVSLLGRYAPGSPTRTERDLRAGLALIESAHGRAVLSALGLDVAEAAAGYL